MLQKRVVRGGLAKQTGKGAPATAPTFGFGLRSGRAVGVALKQEAEEVTSDNRVNPGDNRLEAIPGLGYTVRGYPRLSGLLLFGALGAIVTSGSVAPFTHVATPADDLPWLTHFGRNVSEYFRIPDCKVDQLVISWDGPGPVDFEATLLGMDLGFTAAWTATNEETDSGGKFRGAGGSFKLDIDSAAPIAAPIKSGKITIKNNLEAVILADSIRPNEIFPAVLEIDAQFTLKPDDMLRWREIITGSAAGAAIQDSPVYGSFEVKFIHDINTDLMLAATRVPFLADYPEGDPKGGSQDLEVAGGIRKPSGAAFTATLRNSVSAY